MDKVYWLDREISVPGFGLKFNVVESSWLPLHVYIGWIKRTRCRQSWSWICHGRGRNFFCDSKIGIKGPRENWKDNTENKKRW